MATQTDIKLIKNEIRTYYQNLRAIEEQNKRLERLKVSLKSIEEDINSPRFNHNLQCDVKAVNYDRTVVTGGYLPSSSMDMEIETIYRKLEQEYKRTEEEILQTKALIRKLQNDSGNMEFYLNMLAEDYKTILDMKYKYRKSNYQIAIKLSLSEPTLSKNLKSIYCDISKLMEYYKN